MKKTSLAQIIVLFISTFYGIIFSKATAAPFSQQAQQQSFSMFYNVPICRSLVESYITQDGKAKPVAQASLPLEYYLHKSVPKQYRPIFYDRAEAWNNTVGNEVIRINDEIDQGVFNPETNGSDQKNVIYLISKEDHIHMSHSLDNDINPYELIPGVFDRVISKTEQTQDVLSFLPITDSDIMIREDVLTDIGFYRNRLLASMERLGFEGSFVVDEDIEVIRSAAIDHIINMGDENIKAFLIEGFEVERETLETLRDAGNHQDFVFDALDEVDQRIEEVEGMTNERIREIKITLAHMLLSVDMDLMESQSSFILRNVIGHEMGHGLGLRDYILPNHHPMRNVNMMRPYLVETYSQITILKEIDPFVVYGVFCLYKEYPDITDDVVDAIDFSVF